MASREGVIRWDGKSFQYFTTKDGLRDNVVLSIYEDKKGDIRFGIGGGVSRNDGESFRNSNIGMNEINETFPNDNDAGLLIEDKTGKSWFDTNSNVIIYDGKTFTTPVNKDDKAFKGLGEGG